MIKHLLLIMRRRLLKGKGSFFINLIGLSTGLACVLLVYLWISDELSIDAFHEQDKRLYQVMKNMDLPDGILTDDYTPVPLAPALSATMPEVQYSVSVNDFWAKQGILSDGDRQFQADGEYAGRDFFHVFSYKLIQGDKDQVLADKQSVVISDKLAHKLFPQGGGIVGKALKWENPLFRGVFRVSGVFQSPPSNSSAQFDFLFPIGVMLDNDKWAKNWTNSYAKTYVVLKDGAGINQFDGKIAGFMKKQNALNDKFTLFTQRYSAHYLLGHYQDGRPAGGRIEYVRLFGIVALFILLIACVNFMNLSTASGALKMKEVGVKKAIGATRKNLIIQFLTESMVTVLASLGIAILLVALLLPPFNHISGKQLHFSFGLKDMLALSGIIAFTGIIAGSYPAFYLSGFKPVAVLRGRFTAPAGQLHLRRGLVIFQFTLSVMFIVGVLVVHEQIKYTQSKNLGYNRENVLSFPWKGELYDMWNGLKEGKSNEKFVDFMDRLRSVPGVEQATNMSGSILNDLYTQSGVSWRGQQADENYVFTSPVVGYGFIETLGIHMKEGRSFSKERHDDYSKVILNEAAVEFMGLSDPVGKSIQVNGSNEIIGVVKNFNYGSLHNSIEPMILRCDSNGRNILVRMAPGKESTSISGLKALYREFLPGYSFDFSFMDDDYQQLYIAESRVAALSDYMAGLAIIISSLGLLGLAAVTLQKRFKEVSIRKVHGSSVFNIVLLLSSDFMRPVLISVLISVPLSYLMATLWLRNFAYRITLQWWFFLLAVVITLLIAWISVLAQTIKVARINPIRGLRDE